MSAEIFRRELSKPSDRIIVAYDDMEWPSIVATAEEIGLYTGLGKTNSAHVRVGSDLAVYRLARAGQMTMLDSKFHDTPPTVSRSVREATLSWSSLITVHASGGPKMLEAAVQGAHEGRNQLNDRFGKWPKELFGHVLGITVLTSLDAVDCESIYGIPKEDKDGIKKKVIDFAHMAADAGLIGIVCSPLEARAVRANSKFDSLLVVTPGLTPEFALQADDQKRSTSVKQAANDGVDMFVVGRAINQAGLYNMSRIEAVKAVAEEIKEGMEG